jgi:hypothetical protein
VPPYRVSNNTKQIPSSQIVDVVAGSSPDLVNLGPTSTCRHLLAQLPPHITIADMETGGACVADSGRSVPSLSLAAIALNALLFRPKLPRLIAFDALFVRLEVRAGVGAIRTALLLAAQPLAVLRRGPRPAPAARGRPPLLAGPLRRRVARVVPLEYQILHVPPPHLFPVRIKSD